MLVPWTKFQILKWENVCKPTVYMYGTLQYMFWDYCTYDILNFQFRTLTTTLSTNFKDGDYITPRCWTDYVLCWNYKNRTLGVSSNRRPLGIRKYHYRFVSHSRSCFGSESLSTFSSKCVVLVWHFFQNITLMIEKLNNNLLHFGH